MMDLEAPTVEWERSCHEYVNALEEERQKIQIFQRELPLSLHLVTQTIERYRHQMAAQLFGAVGVTRSELEEEMSSEGAPVLEELIPIKRSPSSEAEGDEEAGDLPHRDLQHSCNGGRNDEESNSTCKQKPHETSGKKPDWLRSVQLWSQQADPEPLLEEDDDDVHTRQRPIAVDARKATGAFLPFHPQKRQSPSPAPLVHSEVAPDPAPPPPVPATSSTCDTKGGGGGGGKGGCGGGDEKDGQLHRKARRCWSPELHRRFLSALQLLGGSDVATPKRIRELMRVDGLTNDEVKSHLQKYRLHSRRPSPTARGNTGNPPPQQVVFVGGIWVPPPEFAAAAVAAAAAVRLSTAEGMAAGPPCGIHAPVASVPAPKHQLQVPENSQRCPSGPLPREGRWSRVEDRSVADGDATRSNSPATSSSSHGTTASPGRRGSNTG